MTLNFLISQGNQDVGVTVFNLEKNGRCPTVRQIES